jgi:hypothetical protein
MTREMRRIAVVALAMFLALFVSISVIQVAAAESLYSAATRAPFSTRTVPSAGASSRVVR